MTERALAERVRESEATALRRLGSDKYLVAATEAQLDAPSVLRSVARDAASGRAVFDGWADDGSGDAAAAFERAATEEREHYERIAAELADGPESDPDGSVHGFLDGVEETVARLGAAIGRALVLDRTLLQAVNFFVNEGDRERADLMRDLRSAAEERLGEWESLLDDVATADAERDRAAEAAHAVIRRAYEEYAAALSAMGVDPKPVC